MPAGASFRIPHWLAWRCACLLVSLWPLLLPGQATLDPILVNGPRSNRFNLVVLSEGYTTTQLADFRSHATNAVDNLLARLPFAEYQRFFNAYAISVPSNQSGSDHPGSGLFRDTYFNTTYSSNDFLIAFPTNSQGQGKVDALLQAFLPDCDLAVLLVNDIVSAGSDGNQKTAIASIGFLASEYLVHEIGHVMAGLGDEYETPYPGFPAVEEPNTTRETNRSAIKWNAWIEPGTPVPTPETGTYAAVVGLFEGAHYNPTGWYRPRLDCAMRSSFAPFCEVCSEALVLALYSRLRPIDSWAPADFVQGWPSQDMVQLSVAVQQPSSHVLVLQWLTNGVEVAGATGTNFTFLPSALGNNERSVTVQVRDATPLVRRDNASLLAQSLTWNELRLVSLTALPGSNFAFRVTGSIGRPTAIQTSPDLVSWTSVATNTFPANGDWFTNSMASGPKRYYRAVTPPR